MRLAMNASPFSNAACKVVYMAETFKARMRRIRVRAGFKSQDEAAQAIGCKRGTVSMWEAPSSSVNAVSEEYLFKVAKAYRVLPQWINVGGANDGFNAQTSESATNSPEHGALKSDLTKKHPKAVRDLRPAHHKLARAVEKLLGTLTDQQSAEVTDLIYKFAGANVANEGEPIEDLAMSASTAARDPGSSGELRGLTGAPPLETFGTARKSTQGRKR